MDPINDMTSADAARILELWDRLNNSTLIGWWAYIDAKVESRNAYERTSRVDATQQTVSAESVAGGSYTSQQSPPAAATRAEGYSPSPGVANKRNWLRARKGNPMGRCQEAQLVARPEGQQDVSMERTVQKVSNSVACLFEGCTTIIRIDRLSNLEAHLITHNPMKEIECTACAQRHSYKRDNELIKHFKSTYPDKKFEPNLHMRKKTEADMKMEVERCPFVCSKCNSLYGTLEELETHYLAKHGPTLPEKAKVPRNRAQIDKKLEEWEDFKRSAEAFKMLLEAHREARRAAQREAPQTQPSASKRKRS
ncbi:uncharacterized protein PGTG_16167 [Puccinia graminis f. sp. tritici CRL 75-36-700-3]|uniref:C2H2-type domain-containing protein n=1 Tax=Puccinia graminis f. sp. tritici (strain CRL 75-36-700-3 / race SCCL) TaxID=418459 RepID=E3L1I2_PUCGT|nr:uncharacterized protein PGTG_16167 [Puccinia graminis f. sp. tritici CRL 75-36-700-3]EFP90407.2 hypothetical protein PGTG_16167 [Puccinia graminis f. sp. tritici CRL 75-36-700-3]